MNILLNGYYGYANAGDEAVLAALLEHLGAQRPDTQFLVTSGDPAATEALHGTTAQVRAFPRQNPKGLVAALRACDLFISGGGSLLQDVTSLRNVVYYAGLMRLARLARKPLMVYAQGVGPLRRPLAQKLARAGVQSARVITVRDEASQQLLQTIGVRRKIEVVADPVWGMTGAEAPPSSGKAWCVALREPTHGEADFRAATSTIRELAREAGAQLRWLPMQEARDWPVVEPYTTPEDDVIHTEGVHPRDIVAQIAGCELMIAMRLHALIFAASRGVPCVAVNYDPKVQALAQIADAPLIQDLTAGEIARLPECARAAQPLSAARRDELAESARRPAQLASAILR